MDEPHQEDPWSQPQQPERDLGDDLNLDESELEEVPFGGLKVDVPVQFHRK
jgi:hypothetical protein